MPKAVLKDGSIIPLEPLPTNWVEGQELSVEASDTFDEEDQVIDAWYRELQAMVAENDPKDFESVEQAIREANDHANESEPFRGIRTANWRA